MYYTKILKITTGGARNLLPLAYERPAPKTRTKRSKTGKNRDFLQKTVFLGNFTQPRLEHTRRFAEFSPCPAQKFPTKITGIFYNITGNYQRISGTIFNYYEQPHLGPQNQI